VQQASAEVQQARSVWQARAPAPRLSLAALVRRKGGHRHRRQRTYSKRDLRWSAEAEAVRANADVQRYQVLYDKVRFLASGSNEAIAEAHTANAQVAAARDKVAAAESAVREAHAATSAQASTAQRAQTQVGGARAQVNEALAASLKPTARRNRSQLVRRRLLRRERLQQLQAAVDEAELELSLHQNLCAAPAGSRAKLLSWCVRAGGQPLMRLCPAMFGDANFKESQIGDIGRANQSISSGGRVTPKKFSKGMLTAFSWHRRLASV